MNRMCLNIFMCKIVTKKKYFVGARELSHDVCVLSPSLVCAVYKKYLYEVRGKMYEYIRSTYEVYSRE